MKNLLPYIGSIWISLRLVAATVVPLENSNSTFSATEWRTCQDYPQLQCRESTVPRFYTTTKVLQGKAEGNLVNLERRLLKGKPTRHIWLFQGGWAETDSWLLFKVLILSSPCTSADVVAVALAEQVAKALVTDYIIQVIFTKHFRAGSFTDVSSRYHMRDAIPTPRLFQTIRTIPQILRNTSRIKKFLLKLITLRIRLWIWSAR